MIGNLGPNKIIWHSTNKQKSIEFLADEVMLIMGVNSDPMRLECRIQNPAYGLHIFKKFERRLAEDNSRELITVSQRARRMLLIPNYGDASEGHN